MKTDERLTVAVARILRTGRSVLSVAVIFALASLAYGQPSDKGVVVLKDETLENGPAASAIGNLIFDPLGLAILAGYSIDGTFWTEFSAETGLWLGDIHVSGVAELRGLTFNVSLEAETQLNTIGITAGIRLTSGGAQLSGGLRTTLENFTLAGRLSVGGGGFSVSASATTQLGDFDVHLGAGLAGSELSASLGATLPLPGDLVTLSAGISYERSGLVASGGADMAFSSSISFSANASLGSTGLVTTAGGQLSFETLDISAHGTWSGRSFGLTSDGKFNLSSFTLLGTLRLDENSFSADVGISTKWSGLTPTLTVGLDQQGFKWIQLEVKGEFNVLGWLSRSQ